VARYARPFATAQGRDALVEHLLALDAAETQALAPRLKELVMPAAVVAGAHDPFVPAPVFERLAADIPQAALEVVPRTGGTSSPRSTRAPWPTRSRGCSPATSGRRPSPPPRRPMTAPSRLDAMRAMVARAPDNAIAASGSPTSC
jgi:hypothetical protein